MLKKTLKLNIISKMKVTFAVTVPVTLLIDQRTRTGLFILFTYEF